MTVSTNGTGGFPYGWGGGGPKKKPKKKKASAPGKVVSRQRQPTTSPTRPPARSPASSPAPGGGGGGSGSPARTPAPATGPGGLPLDPMQPLTPAQMLEAARQSAMAGITPQLQSVDREQASAQAAHDTRVGQITDWAGWQGGRLDKAFADAKAAADNLIALQGGVDQQSKDSLAAALRGATGGTADAATLMGGGSVTDPLPGVLGSAADAAKSTELGIGGAVGASLGAMGEARGLAGIGLQQNQEQERQRFNATLGDIKSKRDDLNSQIPGLLQASLKDQKDFALAQSQFGEQKANRLFQQYLSEKELDLKTKDQTFQQWLARQQLSETQKQGSADRSNQREQNRIAWANVGINQTQANAQLLAAENDVTKAKDDATKERAKARAAGLQSGYDALAAFLAPQKGEAQHSASNRYPYAPGQAGVPDDPTTLNVDESKEALTPYKRLFDDALRAVSARTTSRSDALRILLSSPYKDWRVKAKYMLDRMKRRPGTSGGDRKVTTSKQPGKKGAAGYGGGT